ncbi:lysoplasmalogenase [Paracoccus albus]|uniref:lysoplasmalogenase n=1 Tax=Paracoccus albus TaxID=3017784 RepID=UPI0022F0E37B|nr:lysoplasmalogenase [Paracoccus albus]WBU58901.1 lysoplasmalogenase [Paracoccus albus]
MILAGLSAASYQIRGTTMDPPDAKARAVKTAATLLLGIAALMGQAPVAIALGLLAGAVGDYFLARQGDRFFLAGVFAFALGHPCYAVWMFTPEHAAHALWAIAVAALAISAEYWLLPRTGELKLPVRIYVWIITAMAAAAATLPAGHSVAIAGAALFVISDLLLALRLFVASEASRQRLLSQMVWPAYFIGQVLILIGSLDHH